MLIYQSGCLMSHSKNESDEGLTNQTREAKRQIETLLDEELEKKNKTNFRWIETPQDTTNTKLNIQD